MQSIYLWTLHNWGCYFCYEFRNTWGSHDFPRVLHNLFPISSDQFKVIKKYVQTMMMASSLMDAMLWFFLRPTTHSSLLSSNLWSFFLRRCFRGCSFLQWQHTFWAQNKIPLQKGQVFLVDPPGIMTGTQTDRQTHKKTETDQTNKQMGKDKQAD